MTFARPSSINAGIGDKPPEPTQSAALAVVLLLVGLRRRRV
ncbi:PEP-CTERM sorting domain-containing protein [Bradyrhizobium sp. 930_D9_N1_4]